MRRKCIVAALCLGGLCACSGSRTGESYTRGIGVYPGDPEEFFGPVQTVDNDSYRNVALLRETRHSSSYDYNLTGQLATDGIVSAEKPYYISLVTNDGPVPKREREKVFDDNMTSFSFSGGKDAFLELQLHNGGVQAEKLVISGTVTCDIDRKGGYEIIPSVSSDGENRVSLKSFRGTDFPGKARASRRPPVQGGSQNVAVSAGLGGNAQPKISPEQLKWFRQMEKTRTFRYEIPLPEKADLTNIRIDLQAEAVESWNFQELDFYQNGQEISVLPSYRFQSAWMSEGDSDQWISVDFGAKATFDKIRLAWIERPGKGVIESSEDGEHWTKVLELDPAGPDIEEISVRGTGRFVRLSGLDAPGGGHVILSEMEVYGKGGLVNHSHAAAKPKGNRLYLSGGDWRLQRASEVSEGGEEISAAGYDPDGWIIATVPSTVASSYYNIGAIPDIRYDDDQLQISESFFYSDFWYRDEFKLPEDFSGKELVLNFDGINWKSDIYFNGSFIGHIDGAFTRVHFNVTSLAKSGANALAVKIYKNDNPGIVKEQNRITADTNGGVLGADNPTMHCSIGWDWIPTVRGRNIGIWNDIYLSSHDGGVSIDDVYVETDLPLPSYDYADLKPIVSLTNHSNSSKEVSIQLSYGKLALEGNALLSAGESKDVELLTARLDDPQLWWPAGYGEQYLYDVSVTAKVDGKVSDSKTLKSGVREMSYSTDGGILDLYVNGRRLICNGGNWGFPEINLNYRGREYDIAVAYHADMNFTMIRDWVGQTGDEEFYEACDRHGIMVWQDFWLANPSDGPDPDDEKMFMDNARDYVRKIRNHPSLAIYVGRNEGNPPQSINDALESLVAELHPGMYYIPHSATGMVSGNGPYRALPVEDYFTAERGKDRLHSERGMPNVMTFESMSRMLRKENQWPQNSVWGVHDYTLENAQSCATFNDMIAKAFGEPSSLKQFTQWAQWINYNGYRALYESRSWNRKGLLIWMSHSSWPSMVWQTYDYYFEPTAAYFAAKKASAPIRIQWNPVSGNVEVVNNNAGDQAGLEAYAAIVNYDGKTVWENKLDLDAKEDSTVPVFGLDFDRPELSETYYIKLRLTKGSEVLADNFYWESRKDGDFKQLLTLPRVSLNVKESRRLSDGKWEIKVRVKNPSPTPALMIRLNVNGKENGESILPVFYQDNYFSLLPGEAKDVCITYLERDSRGEKAEIEISGFNL